ncbi:hypothetical protein DIPPA_15966 [Diplonema papillatum]|nr:hypothetical protein DIPPA_15966 [Diplonema papillatum]
MPRTALLAVLVCLLVAAEGRLVTTTIDGSFTFVIRFCFDTVDTLEKGTDDPPQMRWFAEGDATQFNLALFSDQDFSWPKAREIYDSDKSDIEKCNELSAQCVEADCMQKFPGGPRAVKACKGNSNSCPGSRMSPAAQTIKQVARPRIWYVAAVNCAEAAESQSAILHMHVTNPGGWWRAEFGVDEQGILEFQCLIVPIFAMMAGAYIAMAYVEYKRQGSGARVHAVVRWFVMIIFLQLVYYLSKLLCYVSIANDGNGTEYMSGCGFISSVMFLMLLINFSTGFSAVGVDFFAPLKDPAPQTIILGGGLILILLNFFMYLYSYFIAYDPMSTNVHYQSWPAVILAVLRAPIAVYYWYNLYKTVSENPTMRPYYIKWGALFTCYILAMPLFMLLSYTVSPHNKFRVVDCFVDAVTVVSMCAMCCLLWPGPGLSNTLSRTYTLAIGGVGHIPMDHMLGSMPSAATTRSRANSLPPQELTVINNDEINTRGQVSTGIDQDPSNPANEDPFAGDFVGHSPRDPAHEEVSMGLLDYEHEDGDIPQAE